MARLLLYKMAGRRIEGHTKNLMISMLLTCEFEIKVSVVYFCSTCWYKWNWFHL